MKIKIYHGSEFIISKPEYGKGARNNDYGRGFYTTKEIELAKEWACGKGNNGYVNSYELDMTDLKVLNLNDDKYSILNWLAVLVNNRTYWQNYSISTEAKDYLKENFLLDLNGYDIIIGYRADDSYFSFAQDFVANVISLEQLKKAMKLGKLGEQVVLMSKRAFAAIEYLNSEEALAEVYFEKKLERDNKAKKEYRESKKRTDYRKGLFMLDIMREGMKNDDLRL